MWQDHPLNIISGLLFPDRGELSFREGCAWVISSRTRLLPWKSVEANIAFVQENFWGSGGKANPGAVIGEDRPAGLQEAYPAQLSGYETEAGDGRA